jgi:hypothetical protein
MELKKGRRTLKIRSNSDRCKTAWLFALVRKLLIVDPVALTLHRKAGQ